MDKDCLPNGDIYDLIGQIFPSGLYFPDLKEPVQKPYNIDEERKTKMPTDHVPFFKFDEPVYLNVTFSKPNGYFEIKKVIFNNPATIVYWADGTKTVVKCGEDDAFDEEKGLAMAISKRALGNSGHYYETFKRWLPKEEEIGIDILQRLTEVFKGIKRFDGKKISCYDWLKKHHPDKVSDIFIGGCFGCPGFYLEGLPTKGACFGGSTTCEECWKTNYVIEEQNND